MLEEQASLRSNTEAPKQSKFVRFLLKSWQPVPTWQSTILLFLVIGLILLGFGIALVAINASIVEVSFSYKDCGTTNPCTKIFQVPSVMSQPVFFYYEIDNFYQNHRRYINSKNADQLAGKDVADSTLRTDCSPAVTNEDMGYTHAFGDASITLVGSDIAVPCGLIAKSFFNDAYSINNGAVNIIQTGIAWPSDLENKFKNSANPNKQGMNMTNEHFIVWMRTAGLPDFRKLWGRIEQDLQPNTDYTLTITNNYDVTKFDGDKKVVLSTTGPFGGKNAFLAYSYIAVGGACLVISLFFLIRWRHYSKKNV